MRKLVTFILWLVVLGAAIYVFRAPLGSILARFEAQFFPCRQPIGYSLGTFDTRFGISKTNFLSAVGAAEQIWEKPIAKQLFEAEPNGALKINLIYDYRQEATQTLHKIGITVGTDRASYDLLEAKYEALKVDYTSQKLVYDSQVATYQNDKKSYEQKVAYWNARGGAPVKEYNQLNDERVALDRELSDVRQLEANLNEKVSDINAAVSVLNRLGSELNLEVAHFNTVGATQSGEFEEGEYRSGPAGQEIDVYQFDDRQKLIRVLAHELGHALGLDHVSDPKAIMYRLNQGTNEKLTTADLTELKAQCGIK